jgi:hypothetical protein
MSKTTIAFLVGAALVFILAVVFDSRMAAGGGAALLGIAIAYAFLQNRKASPGSVREAERGARELREDKAHEKEKTVDL